MRVNKYIEAFKESYNTVGLAATLALSAAALSPVPLLVGLVMETAYLLVIPDSKWYEKRLSKRFDSEVIQRRQQLKEQTLAVLRPEMVQRFEKLESMRQQIDTQTQADKAWFREILRKLDYLLEKFLLIASKEAQFRSYLDSLRDEIRGGATASAGPKKADFDLDSRVESAWRGERGRRERDARSARDEERERARTTAPDSEDRWIQSRIEEVQAHYQREQDHLKKLREAEENFDTQAVLDKRLDVLQKRSDFVAKIGKILTNVNHQLQLVEDTFGLINDEIRARSPEQILADIEEVVVATNTMASALEEIAPYEQMVARIGS